MDPLFECKICQERTNHKTSNCPELVCKNCNKRGHAQKYCPEKSSEKDLMESKSSSSKNQETKTNDEPISKKESEKIVKEIMLEKRSGEVFRFSKTTSRGLIEIESGKYNINLYTVWKFSNYLQLIFYVKSILVIRVSETAIFVNFSGFEF